MTAARATALASAFAGLWKSFGPDRRRLLRCLRLLQLSTDGYVGTVRRDFPGGIFVLLCLCRVRPVTRFQRVQSIRVVLVKTVGSPAITTRARDEAAFRSPARPP